MGTAWSSVQLFMFLAKDSTAPSSRRVGYSLSGWQPPAWTEMGGEDHYQLLRPRGAVVMAGQHSFASVFLLLEEQTGCFFLPVALMSRSHPCGL